MDKTVRYLEERGGRRITTPPISECLIGFCYNFPESTKLFEKYFASKIDSKVYLGERVNKLFGNLLRIHCTKIIKRLLTISPLPR